MNKLHEINARLGSPEQLINDSSVGDLTRRLSNSHIHLPPNFSAFETIDQALDLAEEQHLSALGVSNYYDYSLYDSFAELASKRGIYPLFGLEIITLDEELRAKGIRANDPSNPGKLYFCGKGITRFNPMSQSASALLQVIRDNDSARIAEVIAKLNAVSERAGLNVSLTVDEIKQSVVNRHRSPLETVYLQERHVAQAFQETIFERVSLLERGRFFEDLYGAPSKAGIDDPVRIQNDIRSFLMKSDQPAYVPDTCVDFQHAYRLILEMGGIPCYPVLADGVSPICELEASPNDLARYLKERGIYCAEMIPTRNSPQVLSEYVHALRGRGLFVTAGTEHNTLDLIPIVPTCAGGLAIPDDLQDIFWEGTCVVAAHQYLTLRGDLGYVDAEGRLNPNFPSDTARIEAFSKLGASVIEAFLALARKI